MVNETNNLKWVDVALSGVFEYPTTKDYLTTYMSDAKTSSLIITEVLETLNSRRYNLNPVLYLRQHQDSQNSPSWAIIHAYTQVVYLKRSKPNKIMNNPDVYIFWILTKQFELPKELALRIMKLSRESNSVPRKFKLRLDLIT